MAMVIQWKMENVHTVLDDDHRVYCAESFLEPGWTEHESDDGDTYYHHEETNTSQWVRPELVQHRTVDVASTRAIAGAYPAGSWKWEAGDTTIEWESAHPNTLSYTKIANWESAWIVVDSVFLDALHHQLVADKPYTLQQLDVFDKTGESSWFFRWWLEHGTDAFVFNASALNTLGVSGKTKSKALITGMRDMRHTLPHKLTAKDKAAWREARKAKDLEAARFARLETSDFRLRYGGSDAWCCLGCLQNHPCHVCGVKFPCEAFTKNEFDETTLSHTTTTKAGKKYAGRGPNFRCNTGYAPGLHICNACGTMNFLYRERKIVSYFNRLSKASSKEAVGADESGGKRQKRRMALADAPDAYPVVRPVTGPYKAAYLQRLVFKDGKRVEEYDAKPSKPFTLKTVRWNADPSLDTEATFKVLKEETPGVGKGRKKTNGCSKANRAKIAVGKAYDEEMVEAVKECELEDEEELRRDELAFEMTRAWRNRIIDSKAAAYHRVHTARGTFSFPGKAAVQREWERKLAGCGSTEELKAKQARLPKAFEDHELTVRMDKFEHAEAMSEWRRKREGSQPKLPSRIAPDEQYVEDQHRQRRALEDRRARRCEEQREQSKKEERSRMRRSCHAGQKRKRFAAHSDASGRTSAQSLLRDSFF